MGAEGMAKTGAVLGAHFQKARFFNQSGFQLQTELICKFLQRYFLCLWPSLFVFQV